MSKQPKFTHQELHQLMYLADANLAAATSAAHEYLDLPIALECLDDARQLSRKVYKLHDYVVS